MNELMWRYALWPFAWRAGCSTLVAAAVLLLLWLLLQPQQQALAQQRTALTALSAQQSQLLQALQPSVATLTQEIAMLQMPQRGSAASASLEQLVNTRGAQLQNWQPQAQPSELVLQLEWREFMPLFSELAGTAQPVPQRFSLRSGARLLTAELWLEQSDAE
jgi:pilus assembly protein HofO